MRSAGWLIAAVMTLVSLALWMQITVLQKSISDMRIQVETAKSLVKRTPTNADQNASSSGITGNTDTQVAGSFGTKQLSLAVVLNGHPEYSTILRKTIRRQLLRENSEIFFHLQIPTEKLEKLKDMMVEQRLSAMDAADAAIQNGIKPDSPAMAEVRKQAQDQSNQDIASLLGPEDFVEWRHVTEVQGWQSNQAVQDMLVDSRDLGEPMTDDQIWKLAEAYQAGSHGSYGANQVDPSSGLSPSDSDQLGRAAQFLSPTQLQVLRNILVQGHQRDALFQSLGPVNVSW